eukprot:gene8294-12799_t
MATGPKIVGKYEVFEDAAVESDELGKWYRARNAKREVVCRRVEKGALVKQLRADDLSAELGLLKKLSHDHVVQLYDCVQSKHAIYVMFEAATAPLDKVREKAQLTPNQVAAIFAQLTLAVIHCHARGVAHRSINPHCLRLDALDHVKLCDFSTATGVGNKAKPFPIRRRGLPIAYLPPEILLPDSRLVPSTERSDLWGMGATLYFLECGLAPFGRAEEDPEFAARVARGRFQMQKNMARDAKEVVSRLLVTTSASRMQLSEIVKHRFIADLIQPEDVVVARLQEGETKEKLRERIEAASLPPGTPAEVVVLALEPGDKSREMKLTQQVQAPKVNPEDAPQDPAGSPTKYRSSRPSPLSPMPKQTSCAPPSRSGAGNRGTPTNRGPPVSPVTDFPIGTPTSRRPVNSPVGTPTRRTASPAVTNYRTGVPAPRSASTRGIGTPTKRAPVSPNEPRDRG